MTRKLFEIMGEVFNIDPSSINDKTKQSDIEKWDSLNSLLLIDRLENEYKTKFSIDDVIEITTVGDIKNILKSHGIDESKI